MNLEIGIRQSAAKFLNLLKNYNKHGKGSETRWLWVLCKYYIHNA